MMSREKLELSKKLLGALLRRLREERLGIATQIEMAERIGVTVYAYGNWERGTSFPDPGDLIAILNECPDIESIEEFGIDLARFMEPRKAPRGGIPLEPLPFDPGTKRRR